MFKRRYKSMMEKCVLPEDEKEKSINRIIRNTICKDNEKYKRNFSIKLMISIVSVTACVALLGGFTVTAYNENWLNKLFKIEKTDDTYANLDKYDGVITEFEGNLKNFDTQLLYSYGNGTEFAVVVKLIPDGSDNCERFLEEFKLKGTYGDDDSMLMATYSRISEDDDGNYLMYVDFIFNNEYEKESFEYYFLPYNYIDELDYEHRDELSYGTFTMSFDMSKAESCPVLHTQKTIGNKSVSKISITPLSISIHGMKSETLKAKSDFDVVLHFNNGKKKEFVVKDYSYSTIKTGFMGYMCDYTFDEVVDCGNISYIEIDGCRFNLDENAEEISVNK